ncbi:MAG: hypothetical protein H7123_06045 [Thermoleophilia bacterium]|nr:hypothetical protein [Thermoleophilia bacterium]
MLSLTWRRVSPRKRVAAAFLTFTMIAALIVPDGAFALTVTASSDQGSTTVTATTQVQAPACASQPLTIVSDQSLVFPITCSGMDTSSISTTVVANPVLGDVARTGEQVRREISFTYVPHPTAAGNDPFTVRVTDALGNAVVIQLLVVITDGPPAMYSAPSVTGTAREGTRLLANAGGWGSHAPVIVATQWQRCDTSCNDISGATNDAYEVGGSDVGSRLRIVVTATSGIAAVVAYSDTTAVVPALAPAVDASAAGAAVARKNAAALRATRACAGSRALARRCGRARART